MSSDNLEQQLGARYQLLRPLDSGGEASVFLARDQFQGGILVAVKVLNSSKSGEPTGRDEFGQLTRLRHRSLATVYDAGRLSDKRSYFTSEYFAGKSFHELELPRDWNLLEAIVAEVCRVLTELRQQNLIHSDLKPAHILYRLSEGTPPELSCRVIDLGMARPVGAPVAGFTAPYAAPELWRRSGTLNSTVDLYALGMCLFELLRGRELMARDRESWRVWHQTADRSQWLRKSTIAVPDSVQRWILAVTAVDPADRPRDSEELLSLLSPPSPALPIARRPQRNLLVGREEELSMLLDWAARRSSRHFCLLGAEGAGKSELLGQAARLLNSRGDLCEFIALRGYHELDRLRWTRASHRLLLIDGLPFPDVDQQTELLKLTQAIIQDEGDRGFLWSFPLTRDPKPFKRRLEGAGYPYHQIILSPLPKGEIRKAWLEFELYRAEGGTSDSEHALFDELWQVRGGLPGAWFSGWGDHSSQQTNATSKVASLSASLVSPLPIAALGPLFGLSEAVVWQQISTQGAAVSVEESDGQIWLLPSARGQPDRKLWRLLAESGELNPRDRRLYETLSSSPSEAELVEPSERLVGPERLRYLELAHALRGSNTTALPLLRARYEAGDYPGCESLLETLSSSQAGTEVQLVAEVLERLGRRDEAIAVLGNGGSSSAELEIFKASLEAKQGRAERALDILDRTSFDSITDPELLNRAAVLERQVGRFNRTDQLSRQALSLARRQGETGVIQVLNSLSTLAGIARSEDRRRDALHLLTLAARYGEAHGRRDALLTVEANRAGVLYEEQRIDEAFELYREIEKRALATRQHRLLPHVWHGIATIDRDRGHRLAAIRKLRRASRYWQRYGLDHQLVATYFNLGELYLVVGEFEQSRRYRLENLRLAKRSGEAGAIWRAHLAASRYASRVGDTCAARFQLESARRHKVELSPRRRAFEYAVEAELLEAEQQYRSALQAWEMCGRQVAEGGRSYYLTQAWLGRLRMLSAIGLRSKLADGVKQALREVRREPNPAIARLQLRVVSAWIGIDPANPIELFRTACRYHLFEESGLALGLAARAGFAGFGQRDLGEAIRLAQSISRRTPTEVTRLLEARYGGGWGAAVRELSRPFNVISREDPIDVLSQLDRLLHQVAGQIAADRLALFLTLGGEWTWIASWQPTSMDLFSEPVPFEQSRFADRLALAAIPPDALDEPNHTASGRCEMEGGPARYWIGPEFEPETRLAVVAEGGDGPLGPFEEALREHMTQLLAIGFLAVLSQLRVAKARIERAQELSSHSLSQSVTAGRSERLTRRTQQATRNLTETESSWPWVVASPALRTIDASTEKWAKSDLPVLVYGESGVGKSRWIERLHSQSPRAEGPFVIENCGALPEALLEAELFGYEPGAFTGADQSHAGLFARASGGTLVLELLDCLSPALQVRLLRILETGKVRPLGGTEELFYDVRLVATLRESPRTAVEHGRLRPDLFYRLQGHEVEIPPLRRRIEEIEPLVETVARSQSQSLNRKPVSPSRADLEALKRYSWPGNIRELINLIQTWLIDGRVDTSSLVASGTEDFNFEGMPQDWRAATEEFQRFLIERTLQSTRGNLSRAAERLGISRRHLKNLVEKYGLK